VMLEPWEERTDAATSIGAIIGAVNRDLSQVPEATAFAFNLPEISGMGATAGLEMNLLDRSGGTVKEFAGVVREIGDSSLLFDFNHPLAGQALNFEVQLIGVL